MKSFLKHAVLTVLFTMAFFGLANLAQAQAKDLTVVHVPLVTSGPISNIGIATSDTVQTPAPAPTPLPDNVYMAGASYNYDAPSPKVAGTAIWAHKLDDAQKLYAGSIFDAIPVGGFSPSKVQTSVGAFVAKEVFKVGKYSVYGTVNGGIAWSDKHMGWGGSAGGLVPVKIYGPLHVYPAARVEKSSLAGYKVILSVLFGYEK